MKFRLIIYVSLFFLCIITLDAKAYENVKEHACLKCHSGQSYTFNNEVTGKVVKRLMNPYYIMDTLALNSGVHKNFDCTDCHSGEYATYPHPANAKLEPLSSCLDCHGGDESFAKYKFEQIQEEFEKSVHFQTHGDYFTCTKCHNIHTYTATARNSSNVLEIVDYNNKMCLSCHNDMRKVNMVAGHDVPKIIDIHSWLPNQALHFEHVRCIECHTQVIDSLMVSHNIMKRDSALRNCVECHSANSRLKASLYKYENIQKRAENGIVGTVLSNSSYVIGTHQSPFLKLLSIIIFIATLIGIIIHSTFRILKKK